LKRFKKSIFIFRKDLRLKDNTGLINALESSDSVYCLFILDKRLLTPTNTYSSFKLPIQIKRLYNRYQKRYHLLQFLKESLLDLQMEFNQLGKSNKKTQISDNKKFQNTIVSLNSNEKLLFLYGEPHLLINKILRSDENIEALFVNRDYSPYSINRDKSIYRICKSNKVEYIQSADNLLNEPEDILNTGAKPFKVFFQYYKRAVQTPIKKVNDYDIYMHKDTLNSFNTENVLEVVGNEKRVKNLNEFFDPIISNLSHCSKIPLRGGRKGFEITISNLEDRLKNYKNNKDIVGMKSTSYLSAYLKLGICSIREVFFVIQNELGESHPLLRQLYWRDFFIYIGFHFPHVFTQPFQEKYQNNAVQWQNDPKQFELWCSGKTGFPIVDAGIRELNKTGYMHNRVRLIAASFLTKDLHIDWRYGERYFALKLVDYDPSINNGNWQWVASTGCDALPYFRTFNPWLQQKKVDPECFYIKEWIPELRSFPKNKIHQWYKVNESNINKNNQSDLHHFWEADKDNNGEIGSYPPPITDHRTEMFVARQLYGI
jgi:deoxyribodipyrimidine photo-lyase